MQYAICLGGGLSQLELIKTIKELGFKIIVVDKNRNCPGFKLTNHKVNLSTHDYLNIKKYFDSNFNKELIEFIFNRSSGNPVKTVAELSKYLGIKSFNINTALLATGKYEIKRFLSTKNIDTPKTEILSKNLKNLKLDFPLIIKPDYSEGGKKGIFLIKDLNRLNLLLESNDFISNPNNKFIIEEYIKGVDYNVGGLCKDGIFYPYACVKEWHNIDKKNGKIEVFAASTFPLNKNNKISQDLINISQKIIKALKVENSFCWISIRKSFDNEKYYFIEIHLDMGGDFLLDYLLPTATSKKKFLKYLIKLFTKGNPEELSNINLNYKLVSIEYDKGSKKTYDGRNFNLKEFESEELLEKYLNN